VLRFGFGLAAVQCQREQVGEVALQRHHGGLHIVRELQLGEIVLLGLEQLDDVVHGFIRCLAVFGGEGDAFALRLAQSAGGERLPLLVDVVAIAPDGGDGIVDRGRQAGQGRVHECVEEIVVVVLDAADIGHRCQGFVDHGLQPLVGGAQLQAANDPEGEEKKDGGTHAQQ